MNFVDGRGIKLIEQYSVALAIEGDTYTYTIRKTVGNSSVCISDLPCAKQWYLVSENHVWLPIYGNPFPHWEFISRGSLSNKYKIPDADIVYIQSVIKDNQGVWP